MGGKRYCDCPYFPFAYDLLTHKRRELAPARRLLILNGSALNVDIPFGAKRIFWCVDPREGRTFRTMEVATGKVSALLQFPEPVAESLSPDGTRVVAAGRRSGALYFSRLSPSGTEWTVERLGPK